MFSQIVDLGVFLSTPSVRRATRSCSPGWSAVSYFYPRAPRGGRHRRFFRHDQFCDISIHALREEGDCAAEGPARPSWRFLSTPSVRRATTARGTRPLHQQISIHALREEGDPKAAQRVTTFRCISIHALREEGDIDMMSFCMAHLHFYPRPPRGGRHGNTEGFEEIQEFLSTPSARRATARQRKRLKAC